MHSLETLSTENVEGFKRSGSKVIQVTQQSDLERVLAFAKEQNLKIYPCSQGKNWGYGSKLPIKDNGVVVDLSKLNEIMKIDEEQGLAFIEPGVTQAQLAEHLKNTNSKFYLDVTGSGKDTSVVGNALERGIAYGGLRAESLVDFEVLLPNGKRLKTGFSDFARPDLEGLYQYGLGPNLQGLFFQSNLGIVTKACIQLKRIQEKRVGVSVFIDAENLETLIEKTKDLLEQNVLEGVPHIGSRARVESTIVPLIEAKLKRPLTSRERRELNKKILSDWMVTFFVSGKDNVVSSRIKIIKKELGGLGRLMTNDYDESPTKMKAKMILRKLLLSSFLNSVIDSTKGLSEFNLGMPSNAGVDHLMSKGRVENSPTGFLLCTPLAPLSPESASELNDTLTQYAARFPQVKTAVTLNVISDRVLEAVISLHFDKSTESTQAHQLLDELTAAYWARGFYPYRININQMQKFRLPDTEHTRLSKRIKTTLDPENLIAPGRYL